MRKRGQQGREGWGKGRHKDNTGITLGGKGQSRGEQGEQVITFENIQK